MVNVTCDWFSISGEFDVQHWSWKDLQTCTLTKFAHIFFCFKIVITCIYVLKYWKQMWRIGQKIPTPIPTSPYNKSLQLEFSFINIKFHFNCWNVNAVGKKIKKISFSHWPFFLILHYRLCVYAKQILISPNGIWCGLLCSL